MRNQETEKYIQHIRSLSYDKLTGVLEEEESAYLDNELKNDPLAQDTWKKVQEKYNSESAKAFFEDPSSLEPSARLKMLLEEPGSNRKSIGNIIKYISIAALVIFAFFIYFLLKQNSIKPEMEKQITLKTADGKVIPIVGAHTIHTTDAIVSTQDSAMSFNGSESAIAGSMNILTVPAGLDYKITLADGTLVWLNSETKLEFPFKFGQSREISITGEAYLEVAPNSESPFTVRLPGDRTIQVLGTSFNVNSYEAKQARVSLINGSVKIRAGRDSLLLKPGYEAVSGAGNISQSKFAADDVLAWRQGKFFFNALPLQEVAKVLSRWYGITVSIDDPAIGNKAFTGSLDRNKPIEEFLDNAKDILNISYVKKDGVLHIK
ncbi:DUF4974 domain-containing protein [Chitinophaga polysaccharea]|uniref:FecR family protein n=1 Tax=Chitinophaga polysaccharea TaxID=1293035 RepID=UPI001455D661|nr:FecR domain-containing protein [Chitinophaga polysaccharea]NLR60702.1 DUF4974 domain-containing protein [Chitinophaga polysaccharea]